MDMNGLRNGAGVGMRFEKRVWRRATEGEEVMGLALAVVSLTAASWLLSIARKSNANSQRSRATFAGTNRRPFGRGKGDESVSVKGDEGVR